MAEPLAPAIHITAYSPTIAALGSTVCREAMKKLIVTRENFANSTSPFSVEYNKHGGINTGSFGDLSTPVGIRELLFQLFNSAYITGTNQGDTVAYAVANYIKPPPSYSYTLGVIPFTPIAGMDINHLYSYLSLTLTPTAPVPAGTVIGNLTSQGVGNEFVIRGAQLVDQGNASGVKISRTTQVRTTVDTGPNVGSVLIFGHSVNYGYDCDTNDFQTGLRVLRNRFDFRIQNIGEFLNHFTRHLVYDDIENRSLIHFAQAAVVTLGCMETYNPAPKWILEY